MEVERKQPEVFPSRSCLFSPCDDCQQDQFMGGGWITISSNNLIIGIRAPSIVGGIANPRSAFINVSY